MRPPRCATARSRARSAGEKTRKSTKIHGKHAGNERETTRIGRERVNEKKREREAMRAYGMGGGKRGRKENEKMAKKDSVTKKGNGRGWGEGVNTNDQ